MNGRSRLFSTFSQPPHQLVWLHALCSVTERRLKIVLPLNRYDQYFGCHMAFADRYRIIKDLYQDACTSSDAFSNRWCICFNSHYMILTPFIKLFVTMRFATSHRTLCIEKNVPIESIYSKHEVT